MCYDSLYDGIRIGTVFFMCPAFQDRQLKYLISEICQDSKDFRDLVDSQRHPSDVIKIGIYQERYSINLEGTGAFMITNQYERHPMFMNRS